MKIGLIGGSFDPIHYGHLVMAEYLRELKEFEKIFFIPTGIAPHKKYVNSGEIRIKMLDLAISDNEYFASSNVEINNKNISYTVDTIKYLRNICPDPEFYFIIGSDNLFSLESWNKIEELGKLTKFIVSNRIYNDNLDDELMIKKSKDLEAKFGLSIEIVDTPIIEISSSEIRERLKKNLTIKYLTPEPVIEYIRENDLYKYN